MLSMTYLRWLITMSGAPIDDLLALVDPDVKFTLMWPDGAVIGEFSGDSIEEFAEDLEDGLIPGVVPTRELIMTSREDVDLISFGSYNNNRAG